ncbi:MAG: hypothetical protein WCD66_12340 [Rhodanobacteraceae bacterium]
MSQPRALDINAPWTARLADTLTYPLRGASGAVILALAGLLAVADMLPSILSLILWIFAWVGVYVHALACLRRSADGWSDPPQVGLEGSAAPAVLLFLLQLLGLYSTKLAYNIEQDAFFVPLLLAVFLPSFTMSLAFGDHGWRALSPVRLFAAMVAFGAAYLLAVAVGLLQSMAWIGSLKYAHGFMSSALWLLLVVYCVLLNFHVLGRLMYRFHERIGYQPEADTLAMATGRDHDQQLLTRVRSLQSAGERDTAFELLAERLRQTHSPWPIHAEFRKLARACNHHQALLDSTPSALACLTADNDWRRALAVVRENIDIQPDYMPPEAAVAGELAEQAANMGMNQLALKLARGYPNTWPREPDAPRYGLLAAQLLADRFEQTAEAGVLASKLLIAFPNCPQRDELQRLLDTIKQRKRVQEPT